MTLIFCAISVEMGVRVDYGSYLLSRITEETGKYGNSKDGIRVAEAPTTKAIVYTGFILTFPVAVFYGDKVFSSRRFSVGISYRF